MTCSNPHCKHEFCWICRNDWKLHNSETGGFFRCNRWVEQKDHDFYDQPPEDVATAASPSNEDLSDPRTMELTYGTAMHETRATLKRSREMGRFLHHYQRWSAHAQSAALEQKLGDSVCTRLTPVIQAAIEYSGDEAFNFGGKGLSFVYAAFTELAECRSMLQHSYAFSFFRYGNMHGRYRLLKPLMNEKLAFEQIQSEVETLTEQMSDVVARARLRATQSQITYLTSSASAKRKEFSSIMASIGLQERKEAEQAATNEGGSSPRMAAAPAGRRRRRNNPTSSFSDEDDNESSDGFFPGNPGDDVYDDGMEDAIRASLQDLNRTNGRPDDDDDSMDGDDDAAIGDWACAACTYVNRRGRSCEMCGTRRT